MTISRSDDYFNKRFSNEYEEKVKEINNYENKINDLLLKKITEFVKENKVLTKENKSSQTELKRLQSSMKNARKEAENWEGNYKVLQLKNKDLFVKLQNTKRLIKDNQVDYSEELPRKTIRLINEKNHLNNCFHLLVFSVFLLTLQNGLPYYLLLIV